MSDEHLMSKDEIVLFAMEMYNQLLRHKNEKIGIKNWTVDDVYKLVIDNIEERLDKIKTNHQQMKFDDKEFIEKQLVHIANYCFFLRTKLGMIEKK